MNKIKQFLMGTVLALGIVTLVQGAAFAACTQWVQLFSGMTCVAYNPDLLAGARWCGTGNGAPGANEFTLFTETNYGNTQHFCQIVPVGSGFYLPDTGAFSAPGLYGNYKIQSIWLGSNVYGYFWSGTSGAGSYKVLGTPAGFVYYENDVHNHWGWDIRSFNLVHP
jgi:hypothetical protein